MNDFASQLVAAMDAQQCRINENLNSLKVSAAWEGIGWNEREGMAVRGEGVEPGSKVWFWAQSGWGTWIAARRGTVASNNAIMR